MVLVNTAATPITVDTKRRWRARLFGGRLLALALLLAASAIASRTIAADPAPAANKVDAVVVLSRDDRLALLDVAGQVHQLPAARGHKATALVFLSVECPIVGRYIPTLNQLAEDFADEGIAVVGVLADPFLTRAAAAKYQAEYRVNFPILFDASLDLAERLKPTHTPEAFVVDARGGLLYRGRIDDAYVAVGRPRARVTSHDLREALQAIARGETVTPRTTTSVGCRFEALTAIAAKEPPVTFCRDVAPVLWSRCVECHRAGEVAPFSLTTYEDAFKRSAFLVDVVQSRTMPPWKPAAGFGHFVGERGLTEREIERLAAWHEAGAPEGDAVDLPPLPTFSDDWQLGEPDLVLTMREPYEIPATGPDVFRWFALRVDLPEHKQLAAVEFRPGCRRAVHHLITFLDLSQGAVRLDAADPAPGYDSLGGPGIIPFGSLGSWGPGVTPHALPLRTAITLPRHCTITLQAHYRPTGKRETDQTRIGLHFTNDAELRPVTIIPIVNADFQLRPGERAQRVTTSFTLPVDLSVIGLTPHMHYLGREMTAVAYLPDGEKVPLIRIADWDFNWQDQYQTRDEIRLPRGTRIDVEAVFDNSEQNPANPNLPPRAVVYGQKATDEMMILGVQVALDKPSDFVPLGASLVRMHTQLRDGKLVILPLQ